MKQRQSSNTIVTNTDAPTSGFSIKTSSKAFAILSSGLYSNKIGAIVRELCCNALDAHRMAGKLDTPFEVDLPTKFDPNFTVRDFGVGMSDEDVKNIYTTYFASTKDQNNDDIGAMGLGCKTPLCYTDSFTVISYYEGIKRTYAAYVGEIGEPVICLLSEAETYRQNGLTVSLSVKDRDIQRFDHEIATQLRYFRVKPILNKSQLDIHEPPKYSTVSDTFEGAWAGILSNQSGSSSKVIMAEVAYPLDISQLGVDELKGLAENVDLYVPNGAVDVAASREQLSYDKETIRYLATVLTKIKNSLINSFEREVDRNASTLKEAVHYVDDNGGGLLLLLGNHTVEWNGYKLTPSLYRSCAPVPFNTLPHVDDIRRIVYITSSGVARYSRNGFYVRQNKVWSEVPYDKGLRFVISDTSSPRAYAALKELFHQGCKETHLIFVDPVSAQRGKNSKSRRRKFFEAYRNRVYREYGGLCPVHLASEIATTKGTKRKAPNPNPLFAPVYTTSTLAQRDPTAYNAEDWDSTVEPDIEKGGLYIDVSGFMPYYGDKNVYGLGEFLKSVPCVIGGVSLNVFGARKKSKLPDHPKWENVIDYVVRKLKERHASNPDELINLFALYRIGFLNTFESMDLINGSKIRLVNKVNEHLNEYPNSLSTDCFWSRLTRLIELVSTYSNGLNGVVSFVGRFSDEFNAKEVSSEIAAREERIKKEYAELAKMADQYALDFRYGGHDPEVFAGFIYAKEMLKQEKA